MQMTRLLKKILSKIRVLGLTAFSLAKKIIFKAYVRGLMDFSLVKKIIFKGYVLGLMTFTLWYGHFVFELIFGFEGKEAAALSLKEVGHAGTKEESMFVRLLAEHPKERKKTDLGYRVIDQPYIKGHFHNIGFTFPRDKTSVCIPCHGNAPHAKSKETRAFMNMHSFYLACETCHSVPERGAPPWIFRWYNKNTGKAAENPHTMLEIEDTYSHRQAGRKKFPPYGDYGAKIAPGSSDSGETKLLHGAKDMALVERFIAERNRLNPKQKEETNRVIHRKVSKEPVPCKSCHREDEPYVPFAELGYPPTRLRELTNNPVVGMVQKYGQFYLPSFMAPDDAGEAMTGIEQPGQ